MKAALPSWARAAFLALFIGVVTWPSGWAAAGEIPERFTIPVLVVHFFPTNGDLIDIAQTGDWGESLAATRRKTQRQTTEVVEALEQGSRYRAFADSNAAPCLDYEVVGSLEYLLPIPTVSKQGKRTPMTDYRKIMALVGIEDWVYKKGVKEVWIWGYHGGKIDLWESNMASPWGDVSNSDRDPNDLPILSKTYTVYHYNYQRGTSEGVEDHMHQFEAVLNHIDGRDHTPPERWSELLFWGRFVGSDQTMKIVRPGCGWAHYPPNGDRDYDWANPRVVETDMDDWRPDGGGRKTRMNSERWGGNSLRWFVYWMQHLPGPANGLKYKGKPLNNWWTFIGDYDLARSRNLGLTQPPQKYRNLFLESGQSEAAVSNRVQTAFEQLFHGDPKEQAVFFPASTNANGPLAYIMDIRNRDVRSEGMSYGMMISVQLDRKKEFDALWNWARTHMHHAASNHPAYGYFSWSMKTNGVANDEMPAPDGEEYFVTALYFAAGRWGNGKGMFNYRAEADQLLRDLRHRQLITGKTSRGTMTAGAIFEPRHRMVRFTPDTANWNHTDPSYHLPAFYELWASWGPEGDRPFWGEAAKASRDFFHRTTHPRTGLAPDYANFDGTPWAAPWSPESANFQYDSWRTAMNWSVDWAWWGKDARQPDLSNRLQAFFEGQGLATYGHRFTLEGKPLGNEHATGLVAMNAVASLAATDPRAGKFVQALWDTPVPSGPSRYYDGMLYLLAMLHCGGEFRIWPPQ